MDTVYGFEADVGRALSLERRWGVMGGVGFEGKTGTIIVAAEALLILAAIALASPS